MIKKVYGLLTQHLNAYIEGGGV